MNEGRRTPPDLLLLVAVLGLLVVGIVMVYSASFIIGHNDFGDENYFLTRHLIFLTLGLIVMGFLAGVDYQRWRGWAWPGVVLAVVLLGVVLVPGLGVEIYGSRRWLQTGGLLPGLQPSEFAKVAVVVFLAAWLSGKHRPAAGLTSGSVPFLLVVGLVAGLIMKEPDMGTTVVVVLAASTVFWVAGANVLHVGSVAVVGGLALAWLATSAAYRAGRLQGWMDPWADPQGLGWHTVQTLIALGSGGVTGLGLGAGRAKAYFVPNAHTDAIYGIVGEELGLLGTVLVLVLFAVVAWRGLTIALSARDTFGQLLAVGVTSLIVWQALLNMMVVTNAIPFTGIPLPFLSFGGSSLVVSLAAVGLLLSVSRLRNMPVPAERAAAPRGRSRPAETTGGPRWGGPRRSPAAPRASRSAEAARLAPGRAPRSEPGAWAGPRRRSS
jgi:cell division protein FtsW